MDSRILYILLSSSILFHVAASEFVYKKNPTLDWTGAQSYCRTHYTDLVTVSDDQTTQDLLNIADSYNDCIWIGLRLNFSKWQWSQGDPSPFTETDKSVWAPGQPSNNGNHHCGVLANSGVFNKECTLKLKSICVDDAFLPNYILVNELKTWKNAQEHCREEHDDLVSMHSVTETETVRKFLTDQHIYDDAWIGLHKEPLPTWSDNHNTNFDNWEPEPGIYAPYGRCGCFGDTTGEWEVLQCSNSKRFFCYGDETTTTTTTTATTATATTATATTATATTAATTTAATTTTAVPINVPDQPNVNVRKQEILKIKFQSEMDLNSKTIQKQLLEQIKKKLGSVGEANFTLKWLATRKTTKPLNFSQKCGDVYEP